MLEIVTIMLLASMICNVFCIVALWHVFHQAKSYRCRDRIVETGLGFLSRRIDGVKDANDRHALRNMTQRVLILREALSDASTSQSDIDIIDAAIHEDQKHD